jgi:hypothetical protein
MLFHMSVLFVNACNLKGNLTDDELMSLAVARRTGIMCCDLPLVYGLQFIGDATGRVELAANSYSRYY